MKKDKTALSAKAESILESQLEWLTQQFDALSCVDSRELAIHMITTLQGASMLANTMQDKTILLDQIIRLRKLIDRL